MKLSAARRRLMILATFAVAALALAGCGTSSPAPAKSAGDDLSGDLNLVAYASVWQEQFQKAVIDPFVKLHPGVTVHYLAKRSSAEMLSALQAEGATPTTDVAIMDQSVANAANAARIFQPFTTKDVPNLAHVQKQFLTPGNYGPVDMADAVALLYDKSVFSKAPTSWNTYWDKKYSGRVAMVDPPSALGIDLTAIVSTMQGEDYHTSIDKAIARLKDLAPSVQSWLPNPDEYQTIITGQTVLSIGQNGRGQYYADQSGGKLGLVIPKEGTAYQLNTVNLRKDAPHEKVAKAFIDYSLSPAAQRAFAAALFYAPSIDNADLPAEVQKRVVRTDGSVKVVDLDPTFVASIRDQWTDRWKREVIGG